MTSLDTPLDTDIAAVYAGIVDARKSVRAFRPDPLPADLMQRVFSVPLRAPSNCNTQPWQVHVASGEVVERLRETLPAAFSNMEFTMDFPYDGSYEGVYKERQHAAAMALYDVMGIRREQKDKRSAAMLRNFEFFGAPHVAFVFLPEPFGLREAADVGMFAQSLMLSMVAHGLGCIPQTALSFLADQIREALGVDPSNKLLFGISFGYEDADDPANRCRTARGDLGEFVRFHG